eukprot:Skav215852  [mRNA]  locus=scaffold1630:238570:242613:- [translate_table: standard]
MQKPFTPNQELQLQQEWKAITHAAGFQPSFVQWVVAWPNFQTYPVDKPSLDFVHDLEQILKHHCDHQVYQEESARKKLLKFQAHYEAKHMHAKNISRNIGEPSMPALQIVDVTIQEHAQVQNQEHGLVTLTVNNRRPWHLTRPVTLDGHEATIVSIEASTIECMIHDSDCQLPPDVVIQQSDQSTDPDIVANALDEYWQQFWGRDPPWDDTESHPWNDFDKYLNQVPDLPRCKIKLNDLQAWKNAITTSKTASAKGVDGWSVEELRSLPDIALQKLIDIFEHWMQHGISWPKSLMQAVTIPLGKVAHPTSPSETRPITILAIVYRWWAKIICRQVLWQWSGTMPSSIVGFIPTRTATTHLMDLQHQLEIQHTLPQHRKTPMGGLTLDLRKCFNTIPRAPASKAMIKAGIPPEIVQQWAESQSKIQRVWQVDRGLRLGKPNTTGCPEGDTFSILACISIAYVWQHFLMLLELTPFVFADNWSWRGHSIVSHRKAIEHTQHFCQSLRLYIDWGKTWTWSTDTRMKNQWKKIAKTMLPQARFQILSSARELGYQIHYTRVHSRATQRVRHMQALRRLQKLKRQKADLNTKGMMAHYAMQKALYAVETYYVGRKWTRELRTAVTQALMPDRMHANPHLGCLVIAKTLKDPEHYIILQSIRATRRLLSDKDAEYVKTFCTMTAQHDLKPQHVHGPAGALAMNLARIGWSLNDKGTIHTDTQVDFDLLFTCPKQLETFLAFAWSKHIVQTALERPKWRGIPFPDVQATGSILHALEPSHHHIIAREILGVYHGTKQKQHYKPDEQACPFCLHPDDDVEHRLLNCPATESVRIKHSTTIQQLAEMDDVWMHLPVLFHDPYFEFRTWIHSHIPSPEWNSQVLDDIMNTLQQGHQLQFWTDGACSHPKFPSARKASFSAVWHPHVTEQQQADIVRAFHANNRIPSSFQTLFVGRCQGEQNVPRAELQAVGHLICMLADLLEHRPSQPLAVVWTDSMYVIRITDKLMNMRDSPGVYMLTSSDHLQPLRCALQGGWVEIRKIKAHVASTNPDLVTFYHLGNEAADHAAGAVLRDESALEHMYPNPAEIQQQYDFLSNLYSYMNQLQQERAKLRKALQPQSPRQTANSQPGIQQLHNWNKDNIWQLQPVQPQEAFLACTWGTAHAVAVVNWLTSVRWQTEPDPHSARLGTTWYELCFAYLDQTRNPIPINVGGTGADFLPRFVYPTDERQNFAQLIYTFERTITQMQQLLGISLVPMNKRQAMGLTLLGNTHGSGGIAARCEYPNREQVWEHLQRHFWAQTVTNDARSFCFPGYIQADRESQWELHTMDCQDYDEGWTARFRRYTALRKIAARLKRQQV